LMRERIADSRTLAIFAIFTAILSHFMARQ
jgi:hypothetical protein